MCGVRLIAPTLTSLRRENILSLVESVRQRRPTVRKLSRLQFLSVRPLIRIITLRICPQMPPKEIDEQKDYDPWTTVH